MPNCSCLLVVNVGNSCLPHLGYTCGDSCKCTGPITMHAMSVYSLLQRVLQLQALTAAQEQELATRAHREQSARAQIDAMQRELVDSADREREALLAAQAAADKAAQLEVRCQLVHGCQ